MPSGKGPGDRSQGHRKGQFSPTASLTHATGIQTYDLGSEGLVGEQCRFSGSVGCCPVLDCPQRAQGTPAAVFNKRSDIVDFLPFVFGFVLAARLWSSNNFHNCFHGKPSSCHQERILVFGKYPLHHLQKLKPSSSGNVQTCYGNQK